MSIDVKTDLPTVYQQFVHLSRYARWIPDEGRRETWTETVDRYIAYMCDKQCKGKVPEEVRTALGNSIKNLEVMPSMRAMMTAGRALERDSAASYNCTGLVLDNIAAFDESLYLLMCGCGVGFSVERQYIAQLPRVADTLRASRSVIRVEDSRIGWANALRELISMLYQGRIPEWDLSLVRPKGSRLETFGGRASGPGPLDDLFKFTVGKFKGAAGRRLNSLECHDIMCKIADAVVAGGVRRSALLSLSNPSDDRMRYAKSGNWWETEPQRALANISACYTECPGMDVFMREWLALYDSKSGERGIFNREAATAQAARSGRRDVEHEFITNPCSEILFRPCGLCNLSEVVVRADDTPETLRRKVELATILGTLQATVTDFRYLRDTWKVNAEEEALLGVSMTGILDNDLTGGRRGRNELKKVLTDLRDHAVEVNAEWSKKLGINQAAAVTCVKPSGCLPGNAMASTLSGLLTFDELLENHPRDAEWSDAEGLSVYQLRYNEVFSSPVSKTYRNGMKPVLKFTLAHNLELESTYNHKWFVKQRYMRGPHQEYQDVKEWVRADEIQSGDILELNTHSYTGNTDTVMAPASADMVAPAYMNDDLAWLLGYLWGRGSINLPERRVIFTDSYMDYLVRAQSIMRSQFGMYVDIDRSSGGRNVYTLSTDSRALWDLMQNNGIWKYGASGLADIPRAVRTSRQKHVISFIAGMLDAGGRTYSVKNGGCRSAGIHTDDARFAGHLQHVSWAVGLCLGREHNACDGTWRLPLTDCTEENAANHLCYMSSKMQRCLRAGDFTNWIWEKPQYGLIPGMVTGAPVYSRTCDTYDIEVIDGHWYYVSGVKSHNTVSQLVNAASGIHPRHSRYYIRTVRASKTDPLARMMVDAGFPVEDDVTNAANTWVFSFPVETPENAVTYDKFTAIDQLELWKMYQDNWCEHKVSMTVNVRDSEWMEVGAWVYRHFNIMSGVAFLPAVTHTYRQAPYQECTEEQYKELLASMPEVTWSELRAYEDDDAYLANQNRAYACTAGNCEIVDLE